MTPGAGATLNYGFDTSGNLTTLPTGATGTYDHAGELVSSLLSEAFMLHNAWELARAAVGLDPLHFHDLRHSGNTWAETATGATTAEIMRRAGHKSAAAAMRYQHATSDRDAVLAAALSEMAQAAPVITISGRLISESSEK